MKTDVAPHLLQPRVAVKHHEIRAVLFCFVLFLFCPGVIRSKLARSRAFWLQEFRGTAVPPVFPPARSFRLRSDPATTSALASDVEQTLSLFLSAKAWRKGRVGCLLRGTFVGESSMKPTFFKTILGKGSTWQRTFRTAVCASPSRGPASACRSPSRPAGYGMAAPGGSVEAPAHAGTCV